MRETPLPAVRCQHASETVFRGAFFGLGLLLGVAVGVAASTSFSRDNVPSLDNRVARVDSALTVPTVEVVQGSSEAIPAPASYHLPSEAIKHQAAESAPPASHPPPDLPRAVDAILAAGMPDAFLDPQAMDRNSRAAAKYIGRKMLASLVDQGHLPNFKREEINSTIAAMVDELHAVYLMADTEYRKGVMAIAAALQSASTSLSADELRSLMPSRKMDELDQNSIVFIKVETPAGATTLQVTLEDWGSLFEKYDFGYGPANAMKEFLWNRLR